MRSASERGPWPAAVPAGSGGFVLYMDLVGYREVLKRPPTERGPDVDLNDWLVLWFRLLKNTLGKALDTDQMTVGNLLSDSVFVLSWEPMPLLELAIETMRESLAVTWGVDSNPMMVRGAVASGPVDAYRWRTPSEGPGEPRPELQLLFGRAVADAVGGAEAGLKGARVRILADIDVEGVRITPAAFDGEPSIPELLWPLHVERGRLRSYVDRLAERWTKHAEAGQAVALHYASTLALIRRSLAEERDAEAVGIVRQIDQAVEVVAHERPEWAWRFERLQWRDLGDPPLERYLELRRARPGLFRQPDSPGYRIELPERAPTEVAWLEEWSGFADAGGKHPSLGVLHDSKWFLLLNEVVTNQREDGRAEDRGAFTYMRMVPAHDDLAVVVLAWTEDRQVIFIEVFRHATRRVHIELPRGFAEEGEDAFGQANEELERETGYRLTESRALGPIYPDTGILGSSLEVVAGPAVKVSDPHPEPEEAIIGTQLIPLDELWRRVATDVRDGITLSALAVAEATGVLDELRAGAGR